MLIGTNWLLGWSHTSVSADEMIKRRYDSAQAFNPILEAYLRHGVDSIMAPFGLSPELTRAVRETEQHMGRDSARRGAKICLIHHSAAEQLVNKDLGQIVSRYPWQPLSTASRTLKSAAAPTRGRRRSESNTGSVFRTAEKGPAF